MMKGRAVDNCETLETGYQTAPSLSGPSETFLTSMYQILALRIARDTGCSHQFLKLSSVPSYIKLRPFTPTLF
jgi:hypothetical protein